MMLKDSQLDPKPIWKIKAKGGPTMAESTLDGGTNNKKNKMAIATGLVTIMLRGDFL